MSDSSKSSKGVESRINHLLADYPGISVEFLNQNHIEELIEDLRHRNQKYIFINTIDRIKSETGLLVNPEIIVSEIAEIGRFAIFTLEDSYFFDGVVGGYVTSGKMQGEEAARLVLELQNGTGIEHIENIINSPNTYIFDQ